MYKANDNSRALAKALYNTNKSFRTCAKVMYNTCGRGTILEDVWNVYFKLCIMIR